MISFFWCSSSRDTGVSRNSKSGNVVSSGSVSVQACSLVIYFKVAALGIFCGKDVGSDMSDSFQRSSQIMTKICGAKSSTNISDIKS